MKLQELDYELPSALIAQVPLDDRDASRLLVLDRVSGAVQHRAFSDLASLLPPSLFVLNNTRVFPARLYGTKATGGKVELLLLERIADDGSRWLAIGRASKGLPRGTEIQLAPGFTAAIVEKRDNGELELLLHADGPVDAAIERHGRVPLPPYIRRDPTPEDRERYQTVFASEVGAVAAPTAGLHFTRDTLSSLRSAGHTLAEITLHVGPGTFRPVTTEKLTDHTMHHERYEISGQAARDINRARADGRPIVGVGTTVVRTLESAVCEDGTVSVGRGGTSLFIHPPYQFRLVDTLLTNFHLPRSTLLALVMAFASPEAIRHAYAEAVREQYRFFSYGDAMLIRNAP